MMDCKTALNENDGNMEAATDWLRTKGLAKAAKKEVALRPTGGWCVSGGTSGAVVEVNSETDFVPAPKPFRAWSRIFPLSRSIRAAIMMLCWRLTIPAPKIGRGPCAKWWHHW